MLPSDLAGRSGPDIALELFGTEPDADSTWTLVRQDETALTWTDNRLSISWRATHGYLVALHEVATAEDASGFAERNSISLFSDGGLHFRGVAEFHIRCNGLPPPNEASTVGAQFRIRTASGFEATVGYASMLYRRLILNPAVETVDGFPDPTTISTVVVHPTDRTDASQAAELALFHLRAAFPSIWFEFWPLSEAPLAPRLPEPETLPLVAEFEDLADPLPRAPLAFYNRAREEKPIPAFLYYYRVLEACFDFVIDDRVAQWRADPKLGHQALLREIRNLQVAREDQWALRTVLGSLVSQQQLDLMHSEGLIPIPSADALSSSIYLRRNSIAHGRRGRHSEVLVPMGFSLGDSSYRERRWASYMEEFARHALQKWFLRA